MWNSMNHECDLRNEVSVLWTSWDITILALYYDVELFVVHRTARKDVSYEFRRTEISSNFFTSVQRSLETYE